MNIESQVASLELCKRLKELGVKQDSYFYWCLPKKEGNGGLPVRWGIADIIRIENSFYYPQDKVSAFTVAELGEMLPPNINNWGLCFDATSCVTNDGIKSLWAITYADYDKKLMDEISEIKLADAMAKMLIHLLENNLIEVEK